MQFGVFSATDVFTDPLTGVTPSYAERIDAVINIARRSEAAGLDVFAIAEHHAPPYFSASPTTLAAAIAAQTETIILNTATTMLTTNDPVRIAEEYAMLDQLAHGRAELTLWRGHAVPSFPWVRQSIDQGVDILIENYHLLNLLWHENKVEWEGRYHSPLIDFTTTPRPYENVPPFVWHSAAFSPEIADHAAFHADGFAINLVASSDQSAKLVNHYRQQFEAYGHGRAEAAIVSLYSQVFLGRNSQDAVRTLEPYYASVRARIGGPDLEEAATQTALAVGSPQQVIDKILGMRETFGDYQRHVFVIDHSGIPLATVLDQLDLLASEVVPVLHREFASRRVEGVPSNPPSHAARLLVTPSTRLVEDRSS